MNSATHVYVIPVSRPGDCSLVIVVINVRHYVTTNVIIKRNSSDTFIHQLLLEATYGLHRVFFWFKIHNSPILYS